MILQINTAKELCQETLSFFFSFNTDAPRLENQQNEKKRDFYVTSKITSRLDFNRRCYKCTKCQETVKKKKKMNCQKSKFNVSLYDKCPFRKYHILLLLLCTVTFPSFVALN